MFSAGYCVMTSIIMRFNIGDVAWHASYSSMNDDATCPDCGGTGRLRVTFHDETQVSIDCQNCAHGYEKPTGRVRVYQRTPTATAFHVTGFEVGGDEHRYHDGCQIVDDADLYATRDAAMAAAANKVQKANEEEQKRVFKKERDTRTWAWNASYHRREIKDANRRIAYHTAKLAVAVIKAKKDLEAAS
jgi:hypothetical protein